ncbi:MAG TPA: trypsin-like peptidase domain-containing protein [Acidothermaceae bacterium]|nr:trypsin-like peptidase domain-containing protein [Acidothermaceae bacterium]
MSVTPENTTPPNTAPAPDPAAVVLPRHRRHRGRSTAVLAGVVAAAVAGAVGVGQLDRPAAAKTQNAAATPSTSSSGTSSISNADWSPYGGGYGWGWGGYSDPWSYVPSYGYGGSTGSSAGSSSGATSGSGAPANVSAIAATVSPGLVDINSTFGYQGASGAGTGIVLTSTGEILTNNHVIDGATAISVTDVGNGKTYKATVVGYDKTQDIAVLQLQGASGLKVAKIGDSSKATVGESVVAIGNAGGTGGTPSAAGGSIIALNQPITASDQLGGTSEQLTGLIEVNANVQPGDSGGSLVNSAGQVIGIDTAASGSNGQYDPFAAYQSGGSANQGFAIPINEALTIAREMVAGKASATVHIGGTAFLGVELASTASYYGGPTVSGAQIAGVIAGGTAAQAGLVGGDVITSLGGHTVDSATTLSTLMAGYHPGTKVVLGWTDVNGQAHTATVSLGSGPAA